MNMQRILTRRILRDLRSHFLRYLALFILIVFGMYLIISIVGAAYTIVTNVGSYAEKNNMEDGEFSVFTPLTALQLSALRKNGITLEENFYVDYSLEDATTVRVYKNRDYINLVELYEGRLAETNYEIVLEKNFASVNGYYIGCTIKVEGETFTVTGIGTTSDYDAPLKELSDMMADSDSFGTAFVNDDAYENLKAGGGGTSEEYVYSYLLDGAMTHEELKALLSDTELDRKQVGDAYLLEMLAEAEKVKNELNDKLDEIVNGANDLSSGLDTLTDYDAELLETLNSLSEILPQEVYNSLSAGILAYTGGVAVSDEGASDMAEGVATLKKNLNELMDEYFAADISNLTMFLKAEDNPRIGASSDDVMINKNAGSVAGIIVMVLFTYIISIFVVHNIDEESSVIGAHYALGIKRKMLMRHYLKLPVLIAFIGGLVGLILGFSPIGIDLQMAEPLSYFSLAELQPVYPAGLLIYGIVMPPVIAGIVNYLAVRKRLDCPVLQLMRREQKSVSIKKVELKGNDFIKLFRIRQFLREIRTSLAVLGGLFLSLLVLMLGVNCYVLCEHISTENRADILYEYMYTYKYPTTEVPDGGEACYMEDLKKEAFGYNLNVVVLGIDEDNPYYEFDVSDGKNQITASSAFAYKYGVEEGDKIILSDEVNEMDYGFSVVAVEDYSVGLYVFMDIDSMRELFGQEEGYYNVVLSDRALNIDSGRLYAVTAKSDIAKSADVSAELMQSMIFTMISASVIVFIAVMYLMIKVMIDRSAAGISILKIFGYRNREVRKLYLDGNFIMILLGSLVCIPSVEACNGYNISLFCFQCRRRDKSDLPVVSLRRNMGRDIIVLSTHFLNTCH